MGFYEATRSGWQSSPLGVSCGTVRLDNNNVREINHSNAQLHGYKSMGHKSCIGIFNRQILIKKGPFFVFAHVFVGIDQSKLAPFF